MPTPDHHRRRTDLLRLARGGAVVIPTAPLAIRNGDVHHPHRPDSDFYYLTHFPEPDAVAVLAPGHPRGEFILFARPNDASAERWDGARIGLAAACEKFGAAQAFPIAEIADRLPKILAGYTSVFTVQNRYPAFDAIITAAIKKSTGRGKTATEIAALHPLISEMRLIKSAREIATMRRAAAVTTAAHRRAMQAARAAKFEYQIQAEFECEVRRCGAALAYPTIAAAAANACTLHYTANNCPLRDGELLLLDAGAEVDCYAADVTRTFPVGGKFSGAQRAVYEIVLAAQTAAIAAVQPGAPYAAHAEAAEKVLIAGLLDLGLLRGDAGELFAKKAHHRFTMHRIGHWLGMDVHDCGDYKINGGQWRLLEPGMVLTVEPGLYIPAAADIPAAWQNIGIRIEDDILVTATAAANLTAAAPKTISDIENLMTGN